MKILFVCSSNICRSPYCEYVFKRMVQSDPRLAQKVTWIRSAAVFNKSSKIHPKAKLALLREGFDEAYIGSHKPAFKWTDKDLFETADVIVGMTRTNKLVTPCKYRKKFITLSEIVDGEYKAVPDPFLERDINKYYAVMDILKDYLERYCQKLIAQS